MGDERFDREGSATTLEIASLIHFAHAAARDMADDPVSTGEQSAGTERGRQIGRERHRRSVVEYSRRIFVSGEKGLECLRLFGGGAMAENEFLAGIRRLVDGSKEYRAEF